MGQDISPTHAIYIVHLTMMRFGSRIKPITYQMPFGFDNCHGTDAGLPVFPAAFNLSVCMHICLSICLFVCIFVYLFVCLYVYLSNCLSICLSFHISFIICGCTTCSCYLFCCGFKDSWPQILKLEKSLGKKSFPNSSILSCLTTLLYLIIPRI